MNDFDVEDYTLILYAISHLAESTEAELATMSPDDEQKDNFEKQLQMCKRVFGKLKGKTILG